jgi:hypothetical protein
MVIQARVTRSSAIPGEKSHLLRGFFPSLDARSRTHSEFLRAEKHGRDGARPSKATGAIEQMIDGPKD